ncbi:transporter substrate-binding domain-containing protein [Cylindrospermopsis curvispora]|nr:transporter substrate-binding domain-containing protein [Cylindrospermopsis curvispora]
MKFFLFSLSFLPLTILLFSCVLLPLPGTINTSLAATMQEIQERGYITIAVKDNIPPLAFRDKQGNLQGLEIDLAKRLARDLLGDSQGSRVKLQPVTNIERLPAVFNHRVDLAIARVTATPSRSRIVSLSIPYYYDGTAIVTKNPAIQKPSDLNNRRICVLNYSSTIPHVKYAIPQGELVGVNSYLEAKKLLDNGQVDACAADSTVFQGWIEPHTQYSQYKILLDRLSVEPLSVVMPKGLQYDELRTRVNDLIADYIAQGWLKSSY